MELTEAGRPVFVYNYGMMLKPGAPDGTVLTDDFPRDHYNHRGLSWMWPRVLVNGVLYEPCECRGDMHARFVRWTAREAGADSARLAVENGWLTYIPAIPAIPMVGAFGIMASWV